MADTNNTGSRNKPVPNKWDEWALQQSKAIVSELESGECHSSQVIATLHEMFIEAMEYATTNVDKPVATEKSTADYALSSALMQMQGMYALMREYSVPAARAANCAAHVESSIRALHRGSKELEAACEKLKDLNQELDKDARRHRYTRLTTTAVRDSATGERIEVTPEMYDAAVDRAMENDADATIGIKSEHLVAAQNDIETGLPAHSIPAYITTKWLNNIAQEAGFNLNMVGQIVVPAPYSDATPYLRQLLKLVSNAK